MLSLTDLTQFVHQFPESIDSTVKEFSIGARKLKFNSQPAIMGVINLSADSWYRESVCLNLEMAVRRLEMLITQGADLVDIGAESTLPHAARVDARKQQSLLVPLLKEARKRRIPVSVETYSTSVTRKTLEAGAAAINLTRGAHNGDIFKMAADHDAAVILCYVQGQNVREVDQLKFAGDPITVMHDYFARQIEIAERRGLHKLFIDPGMGFYYRNLQDSAERVRHQMQTFLQTYRLRELGYPICHALPHAFEFFSEEVRCAEPFFAVLAALGKTDLFRTHEVPRVRAVLNTLGCYRPPSVRQR
ncbi:dihydropteroate synthase [bacterium]|nr:dihydropteroate synthase [bacterium]